MVRASSKIFRCSDRACATFWVVRFSGLILRCFQLRKRSDSSDTRVAGVTTLDGVALVMLASQAEPHRPSSFSTVKTQQSEGFFCESVVSDTIPG